MRLSLRPLALLAAALAAATATLAAPAAAQRRAAPLDIAYRVAMPDPASHLFSVWMQVTGITGATVALQLPVWSPGRYTRVDFAKNLQELRITDLDGRPLAWDKTDGSRWIVRTRGARGIRATYRVFANQLSGTYSVLDTAHANWNGAALFMYVEGHKPNPVTLQVDPPQGWTVLNGDTRTAGQTTYRFENYDRLIDSPTEVAPALVVDSFTVDARKYRSMIHHNGPIPAGVRERFVRELEQIVRYQNTVFGAPPLDQFTFMFNLGFPGGDGMEHLYSTSVIDRRQLADSFAILPGMGTASHEYFHVWNVKRVRPVALGPFDYSKETFQPSLWVAEGWTQYYGQAAMHRSGVTDRAEFYRTMGGVIQANLTAPGRKEVSARMASFHAPFWDGAAQQQATNGANTFFSYYTKGAGLALYLDMYLRARSGNARSLDEVFNTLKRRTWNAPNASYYLQGRGYTELDVERAATAVAGENMAAWFERYVAGTTDMDYDALLARAGLRVNRSAARWVVEEVPGATPEQLKVREGWATGRKG